LDGDIVVPRWLPLNKQELPQTCHTGDELGGFARAWGQRQPNPQNHPVAFGAPTTTADLGIRILGKRFLNARGGKMTLVDIRKRDIKAG
jgi:hypothetical protein